MSVFDGIFVPRERADGSGWDFEAVSEGARPAPHILEQVEGRWADFTAKVRARKVNSAAAAAAEVLRRVNE